MRALIKLSDEGMYGTVEIKFLKGVPEQVITRRQEREDEWAIVPEQRLEELLKAGARA